jgi:hypothetical protein
LYGTSEFVLEHEIGHNFGMWHGMTTKVRVDEIPYNTPGWEGFNVMAGGGAVRVDNEKSRFTNNGHFDPSCKHWYGWIEDADVVFLHPVGASPTCPQCQTSWAGKLNAFDRPDVIPGQTGTTSGSPYFAVKIAYSPEHLLYVYYRSSYPGTRLGVSVQYCRRTFLSYMDIGMNSFCYTYDVAGDTKTMDDSIILPGTTFVVVPPPVAIENIGLKGVAGVVPVIQALSVPDFSDCPDMICPAGKDISAAVSIRFLGASDLASAPAPAMQVAPSLEAQTDLQLLAGAGTLIRAADAALGKGGRGQWNISVCPMQGIDEVVVYLYDTMPFSGFLFNAPPTYQAVNKFRAFTADCCMAGESMPVGGVRVVLIRQLDRQSLSIAELEVYLADADGVNVAPQATCWSLPAGGWYYQGDSNSGRQYFITDGLGDTFSHSGETLVNPDGLGHYDMCVFNRSLPVRRLRVKPRENWASRSQHLSVEAYAFIGVDASSLSELRPTGLLWNQTISMTTSTWSINLSLPSFASQSVPCEVRALAPFAFPVVQGEAYALIRANAAGAVRVRTAFTSTKCPDESYPTPVTVSSEAGSAMTCTYCPATALSFAGNMQGCPGQTCTALIATGNYTGPTDPARSFPGGAAVFGVSSSPQAGRPRYLSTANASIGWNESAGRWDLRDPDGKLIAARGSSWVGSFSPLEGGWANLSDSGFRGGIRAVVIEQAQVEYINLCEIEMYNASGVNVALNRSTCFNLPTTGHWYTGDRVTGRDPRLNDGCTGGQDVCVCAHSGEGLVGNIMACVLDVALPIERIHVRVLHRIRPELL